jgi:NAD(P)-dependent dehydrogenase (short-subunit alcohol dehydrogenase family)
MVTGAGCGIGSAYARMLVALGASIVIPEHVPPASRSFVLPALRALDLDPESVHSREARGDSEGRNPRIPPLRVPTTDKGDGETDPHCGHRAPDYQ